MCSFWFWDIKFNQQKPPFTHWIEGGVCFLLRWLTHVEGRCVDTCRREMCFFGGPTCKTFWNLEHAHPTKISETSTFKGAHGSTSLQTKKQNLSFLKSNRVARFRRISMFCREDFQQKQILADPKVFCGSVEDWAPGINLVATPLNPEKSPYGYGTSTYPTGFSVAHDRRTSHSGWVLAKGTSHHFWHLFFWEGKTHVIVCSKSTQTQDVYSWFR